MRGSSRIAVVVALILTIASARAHAQSDTSGRQEAVRLFEQSVGEYRAGRFQAAADLLRRAYALQPEPTLLYNLGRALEGLGDEAGAIDGYSRYLEAQPNAPDRGALERRIETLRQRLTERQVLAEERRQQEERDQEQSADEDRDREREQEEQRSPSSAASSGPGALPWIVAAAGGVVLAGGGVLGFVATSKADDADAGSTQAEVWDRYDDARSMATAANVCFIAGGVLAAVGLTWGIVGNLTAGPGDRDEDEVRAGSPRVSFLPPTGMVVTW